MIQPTIGRVVLYHPAPNRHGQRPEQPWPALIAFVHGDRLINVGGFNAGGAPFSALSVPLLQDDEVISEGEAYACWMPYQKGQAAKTEDVAGRIDNIDMRVNSLEGRLNGKPMGLVDAAAMASLQGGPAPGVFSSNFFEPPAQQDAEPAGIEGADAP